MQRKSLILLALVALALGGLYALLQRQPEPVAPQDTRYFPGLDAQQVSAVTVRRPGQPEIRVARQGARWVMPAKAGYPAAGRLVGDLLHELAQARKVEAKTREPGNLATLGVAEQGEGSGVRLVLERSGGAPLELLVGKAAPQGGRLVRQPGDPQVWLIDQDLRLPPDELDWLDRRITSIPFETIAELSVSYPGGETLTVFRERAGEPNLQVRQLPKGAKLAYEAIANGMATPFAQLTFGDAAPLDQVQFQGPARLRLSLKTLDGGQLDAHVQEQGGQNWLLLDRAQGFADGQVQARSGWAYRLDAGQFQALARHLAELTAKRP
ncbi:DUF4340 domain-containing protein [Pseudomonas citronellolis]|uniref:DUF4340 domain-containing protein n=1 Tax=Pseudomonas citronellolis TaxID=53408 RepID=UPI0023E46A00|nr:DUF4340 domain-containing protein [Pseudomonas citronellolis]MDF3931951.1 DUF4340 domain-containing protein [Pseudomonas citronellolis]